jgi:hypothetical protein
MTGSIHWPTAVLVAGTMLLIALAAWLLGRSRRRGFLSEVDRATYATLHTASLASQHLGEGLTPDAAERAGRHLLSILGAHAVSIADAGSVLSWTGLGDHHRGTALALGEQTRQTGRTVVHGSRDVVCADPDCPLRSAVTAPLVMDDLIVGTLTAVGGGALRDVLAGQVPEVLRRELYALPALLGSTIVVIAYEVGFISPFVVWGAAALVFGIRMVAIVLHLNAPQPFRLGDPR